MILLSLYAWKLPQRSGIPKKDRDRTPVSDFPPQGCLVRIAGTLEIEPVAISAWLELS
tara:strand:- start:586 stop:759 length:174 start_codon:yes stop_codon:yes gene_type:complete